MSRYSFRCEARPMLYLLLNIVFSSFFILCIKWVHVRKDDIVGVGMVNYVVAAMAGSVFLFGASDIVYSRWSILTGAINGACYFVCFFVLVRAVAADNSGDVHSDPTEQYPLEEKDRGSSRWPVVDPSVRAAARIAFRGIR